MRRIIGAMASWARLRPGILAGLLVLSAVVAYLPAIDAGFIWDDDLLLTQNAHMRTAHGLGQIWLGKGTCEYTPLTSTTFWLENRLWADIPTGYHTVNILLHAGAAVLLWRILLQLQISGAWLAGLLFAIHPVNVASVAWIAERRNTLSGVLCFASILAFIAAYKRVDRKLYLFALGLFLLAGLSKGAVVTIPVVLAGSIIWMKKRITGRDLASVAPFVAVALIVSGLTISYQAAAPDYNLASSAFAARVARAGFAPWVYLGRILLPTGVNPMTAMWMPDVHSLFVYFPPFMILAVMTLFFLKRHTWGRPLLFVSGYYLCMLLPVLGLVWMAFQQETPCADWWQYLAAPAILAGIAGGFYAVYRVSSGNRRLCLHAAVVIVVSLLFAQTWRRCGIYQSMESYSRAVLADNPHLWTLQNNLGILLKKNGDLDQAAACYRQALDDNPRFAESHNNLGNALSAKGEWREAESQLRIALQLQPRNPAFLESLSDNFFNQGRIRQSLPAAAEAIRCDPYNSDRYAQFGAKLCANGQFEQAIACFNNALVLTPGDLRLQVSLARALVAAGRIDDAAAVCEQALLLASKSGEKHWMQSFAQLRDQCHAAGPN